MLRIWSMGAVLALSLSAFGAQPADLPKIGGANSPEPSPPPKLVIDTAELAAGPLTVKVPTGSYTAPEGGAPNYAVPGPIVSFKGADGVWRGHGYLETYPRLLKFTGKIDGQTATLDYQFENNKSYQVTLTAKDGLILIDETANLGPRNLWVFDFYYQWQPSAGFVTDLAGKNHAFLYMPCFYDKPEVTINPQAKRETEPADAPKPGAVAVVSPDPATKDIAGFFARDAQNWKSGDTMGIQLWQHRQLPGDPSSRHFLGPETKSDSTPNPRTADLMGKSLYEGHVTVELNLGTGTRKLAFAISTKGDTKQTMPDGFKKIVQSNQ